MTVTTSRTMIAALQVSLDGFIQGPEGEKDWVGSWADALGLIPDVDTFVLGARMYPDYGTYWHSIEANPDVVPPFQQRVPSKAEIAYARLAARTPRMTVYHRSASGYNRWSSSLRRRFSPGSLIEEIFSYSGLARRI